MVQLERERARRELDSFLVCVNIYFPSFPLKIRGDSASRNVFNAFSSFFDSASARLHRLIKGFQFRGFGYVHICAPLSIRHACFGTVLLILINSTRFPFIFYVTSLSLSSLARKKKFR